MAEQEHGTTIKEMLTLIKHKVQEQGPLVSDEIAELNKARRMVWLADLRTMIAGELGTRCMTWVPSMCSKPEAMREAFNRCTGGTGVIIHGPIGTGKTTMAVHMLLGLAYRDAKDLQERGFGLPDVESFAYVTRSADLFRALSARYGDGKDRGDAIMATAKAVRYLLIDDVGREAEDAESFAAFQSIMDDRYAHERPVIIATNLAPSEYAQATTDRTGQTTPAGAKAHWIAIISRWKQTASWITLGGNDLRQS